jgi:hypothetical protein
MALNVNSGLVNVTGTVTSTAATHHPNGFIHFTLTLGASHTIGTVGAGKKWTILAVNVYSKCSSGGSGEVVLLANGNALISVPNGASATTAGNQCNALVFPYNEAPVITAAQTITITTTHAAELYKGADVIYVEEDA